MAPVMGIVNVGDIDHADDGRDQSGPYDLWHNTEVPIRAIRVGAQFMAPNT